MSVITREQAKTHIDPLGEDGTTFDTFYDQLIPQCEAAIADDLQRTLEEETFTEYYSGTGTNCFRLRNTPVQSITSIYFDDDGYFGDGDDSFESGDLLTEGVGFVLSSDSRSSDVRSMTGKVYRISGTWNRPRARKGDLLASVPGDGLGNIKVTYVAGWNNVPRNISLAILQMVSLIKNMASTGQPMQSEGLDYYNYTAFAPDMLGKTLGSVQSLLRPYKKVIV